MSLRPKYFLLATLILAILVISSRWTSRIRHQNLLLVTLDTTRADRLGCYGYARARTPNIDQLAANGLMYENAFTVAPITLPAHASLLTGLLPPEHGLRNNGTNRLPDSVTTLAEIFKRQGYRTGAFVSSFVLSARFGLTRGFDVYDDQMGIRENDGEPERLGDLTTSAALAWLDNGDSNPFFCWVHLYDPHQPYRDHSSEFGDEFAGRPYDEELAYADKQIGRLLNLLDQRSWRDRTMIVVVGDHGEGLGEHQETEHGYLNYNSTMHVPLIVVDPRSENRGHRLREPVSLVDVFPTILNLFRLPQPEPTFGQVLPTAPRHGTVPERGCYGETDGPYLEGGWSPLRTWTTSRWKFIHSTRKELFDLLDDPHELRNLISEQPVEATRLEQALSDLQSQLRPRKAKITSLTADEQRALETLGYTGGQTSEKESAESRRDIKDTILFVDQLHQSMRLIRSNDFSSAQRILEEIVKGLPDYPKAWAALGFCCAKQEDFIRAEDCYRRALSLDSNQNVARIALGRLLLAQDRLPESLEQLHAAVRFAPTASDAQCSLAEVYRRLEQWDESIMAFQTALRLSPGLAEARTGLANALRDSKRLEKADE